MSVVWCLLPDVRRLTSDVWCHMSDTRRLMSDVWYQTFHSDVRRLMSYDRRLMSYVWCLMSDVWCLSDVIRCLMIDVICLISDIWWQTSGVRYLMSDIRCHFYIRVLSGTKIEISRVGDFVRSYYQPLGFFFEFWLYPLSIFPATHTSEFHSYRTWTLRKGTLLYKLYKHACSHPQGEWVRRN